MIRTVLLVAFMILMPVSTQAFTATNQTVYPITDTTSLYTLTFELGYGNQSMLTPLFVQHAGKGTRHLNARNVATVSFNNPRTVADMQGIILSDATIKNNEYFIPANEKKTFRLVVIASSDVGSSVPTTMQVQSLPFTLMSVERITQNGLSAGELQSFRTVMPAEMSEL